MRRNGPEGLVSNRGCAACTYLGGEIEIETKGRYLLHGPGLEPRMWVCETDWIPLRMAWDLGTMVHPRFVVVTVGKAREKRPGRSEGEKNRGTGKNVDGLMLDTGLLESSASANHLLPTDLEKA
jgi:hypothetical protein